MTARPLGWALATPDHSYWLPASLPGAAPFVASLLAAENLRIVSPQVKRDYVLLARLLSAAPLLRNYFDVTVAHYILQPDMRHYLPLLASQFLGAEIPSLPARQTLSSLPQEQLIAWATASAWAALRLRAPLEKQVADRQMSSLLNEIELPLIPVLADMELTGVRVDVSALNSAADSMRDKIADIEKNIYTIAGEEFNVGSPAKVGEILFDKLGLAAKPKKTKTGQYSTSEEELEKVAHLSPIVPLIIEYRQLKKLLNTYLIALPATINPLTGRIHTTYNQTVTATGRISSSDPNLQNIPVREALGREIRRAFIPSEGNIFLSADYSQIELRLVADFAKDQDMLAAFAADRDIHAMTAAKSFMKAWIRLPRSSAARPKRLISVFSTASRLSA